MHKRIKWGVLSTAMIGVENVIPGMQGGARSSILGIASRDTVKARAMADRFGIERSYGSYEALLEDPDIQAVYIPLPNHMHLEWTRRAIENGKHVLCEKPLALAVDDVRTLIAVRDEFRVKVGEAFMVQTHPQWVQTRQRIQQGELGVLKAIQGFFSYHNDDPVNIRNVEKFGGGALWDIGVYPIHTSRFILGEEPVRVCALIKRHSRFKTDVLSSVIIQFPSVQLGFQCSTLLSSHQSMQFFGDKKRLEIEIPFNAPADARCRLFINEDNLHLQAEQVIEVDVCNQYAAQGDAFSLAILNDTEVPVPLENSLWNTATVAAIFRSAESGQWEDVSITG